MLAKASPRRRNTEERRAGATATRSLDASHPAVGDVDRAQGVMKYVRNAKSTSRTPRTTWPHRVSLLIDPTGPYPYRFARMTNPPIATMMVNTSVSCMRVGP